MNLYVRITAIVAIAIVALIVLAFVLKIVLIAALVGGLIFAGVWVGSLFRNRNRVRTLTVRRY